MGAKKKSTKTGKAASAASQPAKPAGQAGAHVPVRVRMYRTGLGDCFLITFDPGGREVHMLIDCGSLGAKTTGKRLADAVADIRQVTKDHLHLVIATHEHKDHVCGFRDVNEEFRRIKVDCVWLAWTENPADELSQQIAKYRGDLGEALAAAASALTAIAGDQDSAAAGLAVRSLLGFAGEPESLGAAGKPKPKDAGKAGLAKTIDEAMTFVRTGMGAKARYLNPGEPAIELDWLPGFRFHVLGPPRSLEKLGDLGEHGSEDIYGLATGLHAGASLREGVAALDATSVEAEMPFDPRFRCPEGDKLVRPQLASYLARENAWRRVDHDWLRSATDFALQLDSLTNNTSLVLAIERISDGKVLLFPADAQEGNWLSWHDPAMKLTSKDGDKMVVRTAEQLLNATVFYKVGHHGSHNATASRKGLEMMTANDELVAFIPVDRDVALGKNPKGSWRMPAPELYARLLEKCQGRVVRSDLGWADDAKNAKNKTVEKELAGLAGAARWTEWKQNQQKAEAKSATDRGVRISDLFIDFLLT